MCDRSGDGNDLSLQFDCDKTKVSIVEINHKDEVTGTETYGRLFVGQNGKMEFEGDVEDSARIFFDHLKKFIDPYIEKKLEKAKELCRKYATASEYYDNLIEDKFIEMPFLAKKLVNQVAQVILDELESGKERKTENSEDVPRGDQTQST